MNSNNEQVALACIDLKLDSLIKQWKAIRGRKVDGVYRLSLGIKSKLRSRQHARYKSAWLTGFVLNLAYLGVKEDPSEARLRTFWKRKDPSLIEWADELLCDFGEQIKAIEYTDINWATIMDFTKEANDCLQLYSLLNMYGLVSDSQFKGSFRITDEARKNEGNATLKRDLFSSIFDHVKTFLLAEDVYDASEIRCLRHGVSLEHGDLLFQVNPQMPLARFEEKVNGIRFYLHTRQRFDAATTVAELETVLIDCLTLCNFKPKILKSRNDERKYTKKSAVKLLAGLIYDINLHYAEQTAKPDNNGEPVRSHIADEVSSMMEKYHFTIGRKAIMNSNEDLNSLFELL